ncbi:MAG: glycosyltransferase family 9 protein [Hyphomicrobiales bacterium]|nr:glycosyltransferase family 9 protein [Hyphomicrobiales bacterium]MBV8824542.1 glycosyltransferase family 9 protein [Hyphomicrobiales bacterium]
MSSHGSDLLRNTENPRILVIALRRLGDVLLTTPLVRSLKRGVPGARVDMLVFRGTEGILAGNPDIDAVMTVAMRPTAKETRDLIRGLWRRYDLAVSTQTGDRPTFLAFIAGRRCAGLVPAQGGGGWWKRRALNLRVMADSDSHRVVELLGLTRALGVPPIPELVPPAAAIEAAPPSARYAVLHANPLYRFRRWTDEGWRALARALAERGLRVFATGGPDPEECAYLDRVWNGLDPPVERLDGKLDWPQLAALIRGAAVYVGPDTSMTHLAAATGCPTIGLYGPASPHVIGPWPIGGLDRAWARAGTIQRRGNVWVVQNPLPCLPCERLGCDGHYESRSQCLDELLARQVLAAVDQALAAVRTGGTPERVSLA